MIKVTILGCGASLGAPVLGCSCKVCTSPHPKNKRLRSSILISHQTQHETKNILVDCGFDIKQQLMTHGVTSLDAVILTHHHADHLSGIDELRVFSKLNGKNQLPIYISCDSDDKVSQCYDYMFKYEHLKKYVTQYYQKIEISGMEIEFFKQNHVVMDSFGIRINNFVYANDVAFFYDESEKYLQNMDVFLVDCCDYQSSRVHAGLERVLCWQEKYSPAKTYLTNLSHKIDYFEIQKQLPQNIIPAYDGLTICI